MERNCKISYINKSIYITSDDEIKEGDWFISDEFDIVGQLEKGEKITNEVLRKIIATTDKSLGNNIHFIDPINNKANQRFEILPQPSPYFIQKYIEEYNKGKIVKDVVVEYIDVGEEDWMGDDVHGEPFWNENWTLKINPSDNTITIKELKNSWSREEVKDKLRQLYHDLDRKEVITLKNWIDKNL